MSASCQKRTSSNNGSKGGARTGTSSPNRLRCVKDRQGRGSVRYAPFTAICKQRKADMKFKGVLINSPEDGGARQGADMRNTAMNKMVVFAAFATFALGIVTGQTMTITVPAA